MSHWSNPFVYKAKPQNSGADLGTCEYSHTRSMSLDTPRDSRRWESPTPYQEFVSRTQAVHRNEANYI